MDKDNLELWGHTLLAMARMAQGSQNFFELFQDGYAKKERKADTLHEEFAALCRKTFGNEGIEAFNTVMKEFYENAGVVPRAQYNELYERYGDLKEKVRELEEKIEGLKRKIEGGADASIDLMEMWTDIAKKYTETNRQFFEEFNKFFKQ